MPCTRLSTTAIESSRRSSLPSRLFELFDEYAAAYARGERPSAEAYLDRAGSERNQLALLFADFLRRAPVHDPSEDDKRYLGLMLAEEPPLLSLRVERGLRVDEVVSSLVDALGLEPSKSAKVKRYYQRLEGGLLDPRGLSKRLRTVLSDILGASESAISWTAAAEANATAFLRRADYLEAPPVPASPASEGEDEIDRLFTGGK
jgi:hypothetical protein